MITLTFTPEQARGILYNCSDDRLAGMILDKLLLPNENAIPMNATLDFSASPALLFNKNNTRELKARFLLAAFLAFMDAYPKPYDGDDREVVRKILAEFYVSMDPDFFPDYAHSSPAEFDEFAENFLTENWKTITQQQP